MASFFTIYKSLLLAISHFIVTIILFHTFKQRKERYRSESNYNKICNVYICCCLKMSGQELLSIGVMIFCELSLFFTLLSSIGGSINNINLCNQGYKISTVCFYLNFILLLWFQVLLLKNCFENVNLPQIIRKFEYPKHIFMILQFLLGFLSISIIFETFTIPSFTSPSSDIGCLWKLDPNDSSTSLLIVIWSWFNGLCLFFVIWLLLGMYGYKCFQFKSQYKLSLMYEHNINLSNIVTNNNIGNNNYNKNNHKHNKRIKKKKQSDITIDNVHDIKQIVIEIYYLLQKVLILMILTEFTGFIVIISFLITWISEISVIFIYFVFTMTIIQLIGNTLAITLMLPDNQYLFEKFALCFESCFKCFYQHLYDIINENRKNRQIVDI